MSDTPTTSADLLRRSVERLADQHYGVANDLKLTARRWDPERGHTRLVVDVLDRLHELERRTHAYLTELIADASQADIARAESKAAGQ